MSDGEDMRQGLLESRGSLEGISLPQAALRQRPTQAKGRQSLFGGEPGTGEFLDDQWDEAPLLDQVDPTAQHEEGLDKQHGTSSHGNHHWTEAELQAMNAFESLDYDLTQNELYRRDRIKLDQRVNSCVNTLRWLVFALIGILTGTLAWLMGKGVDFLFDVKFSAVNDRVARGEVIGPFFIYTGICVGFVLVATFLVAVVEPVAGGSGIPEIKAYLNGSNYLRFLRLKTLVVKVVGVCFSVAAGLAIGKEGPLVHSGAIFAANISHLTGVGKWCKPRGGWKSWLFQFRNDKDKRDYVSGGAAAGVAAAFGAPVGGILFSLEEASSYWSIDLTWRAFLCSMLGTFMLNFWKVALNPAQSTFAGLLSFGPAMAQTPFALWEIPFFFILAVFGGVHGAAFNYVNEVICKWRRDVLAGRPIPRMLEALGVGLLTAICAYWAPLVFNDCRDIPAVDQQLYDTIGKDLSARYQCEDGQYNTMASMIFVSNEVSIRGMFHNEAVYDWRALVAYYFIISLLAVITYGIAVPSGLFVPCILMGCSFGRLMGEGMRWAFPGAGIVPGTYALIGATASLGGVARMLISLTVILLETTGFPVPFIMPIMLTLIIAKQTGDLFNISLYDLHVELKCCPFVESAPSGNMYHLRARDVMVHPVVSLREVADVGTILRTLRACAHNGFPVVTEEEPRRFVGMILRNELVTLVNRRIYLHAADREQDARLSLAAPDDIHFDDFATSLESKHKTLAPVPDEHLGLELDLRPYMNPVPISVQMECPLSRVYVLFRSLGIRHLVITDASNQVKGMISRKDISSTFDQDLF